MLSMTPFFTDALPSPSACQSYDYQPHHARLYTIITDQSAQHLQPDYSLIERDQQAHLEVELPGVAKENIDIGITGNKLVITANRFSTLQPVGEKPVSRPAGDNSETAANANAGEMKDANHAEQPTPSVVYKLDLRIGRRYATDNIRASMHGNGILTMVIPMKESEATRKINIV